jgi:predicted GNAT superfamily acetyltransferase
MVAGDGAGAGLGRVLYMDGVDFEELAVRIAIPPGSIPNQAATLALYNSTAPEIHLYAVARLIFFSMNAA